MSDDSPSLEKLMDMSGWCGCGRMDGAYEFIVEFMRLLQAQREKEWTPDSYKEREAAELALIDKYKEDGLRYFVYYWLDSRGFTEHGGSVPGWIDSKGEEFIRLYEKCVESGELEVGCE